MIAIVVGMHRSGTSALAGVLHHQGIVMGEPRTFRPQPSAQNPKGFYENIRFRRLSDRMLRESAYDVTSWDPLIPRVRAARFTRFRARRLLSTYSRAYPAWGWKDPRLCLTLGVWLEEIDRVNLSDQVKLVYIFRQPETVAHSIVRRGNTDYEHALRLWTVYNRLALDAIDSHPVDRLFVTYNELCHEAPRTSATLSAFLGTRPDPVAACTVIDQRLDRSSGFDAPRPADLEVKQQAGAVEAELGRRHSAPL